MIQTNFEKENVEIFCTYSACITVHQHFLSINIYLNYFQLCFWLFKLEFFLYRYIFNFMLLEDLSQVGESFFTSFTCRKKMDINADRSRMFRFLTRRMYN